MNTTARRTVSSIKSAFPKAIKTIWWLLKIILPISLLVTFLQYWGIIAFIAGYLSPVFSVIGLPGESAIVFISSIFLPLYGPVAIISTLPLDIREIIILAIMCLISHNLFVETAVQKKTGSSAIIIFSMRLIASFVAAFIFNLVLPDSIGSFHHVKEAVVYHSVIEMLIGWTQSAGGLILKITMIVCGLMALQNILKEFNILILISKAFSPFMKIMGLSKDSTFLWFIGQIVGLTYGSIIMIEAVNQDEISREDANLLNYHIAINHSLLEDTLLFVAIGVPIGWITIPRIILAIIVVWSARLIISLQNKKNDYNTNDDINLS